MRIDLHVHSALSDGTDSIPQLVEAAKAARLDVFALTDHDTMLGVDEAQRLGKSSGIGVLRGMEISTHIDHGGKTADVHLLGYGCRDDNAAMNALLLRLREARDQRIPRMLDKLADLGMPVDLEEVQDTASSAESVGRPHVADAMVRRGYVPSRDVAFRDYLYYGGPAYVGRYTPTTAEAMDAVIAACGVPVLAHPWSRGNDRVMTEPVITDLARHHGLFGLEADHVDHTPEMMAGLRRIAGELGLVVTGSSDYHGLGKTRNPLGACLTDPVVYHSIVAAIEERHGTP